MKEFYLGGLNSAFGIDGPQYIPEGEFEVLDEYDPHVNNSPYQRQLASEHCKKLNENQGGTNNRNAKTWRVTFDDGREEIIQAIYHWGKTHGYKRSGICNLHSGKVKSYMDMVSIVQV